MGKLIERVESFESMKMLIATEQRQRIEAEILIYLEYSGYRVMVKEIDAGPQGNQMVMCKYTKPPHSDTIPGFEDVHESSTAGRKTTTDYGQGDQCNRGIMGKN